MTKTIPSREQSLEGFLCFSSTDASSGYESRIAALESGSSGTTWIRYGIETVRFPYDGTTMTVEQQINTSIKKVRLVIHSINFGDGTKYPNDSTVASSFLSTSLGISSLSQVVSLTYRVYYSGVGKMYYPFDLGYDNRYRKFNMARNDGGSVTTFYNLVSYSINNNIAWDY